MMEASMKSLRRAWNRAAGAMADDPAITKSEQSAGFIIPNGQVDGYQVFVTMYRYSESLFRDNPETGGLLIHKEEHNG